jgi:integrase
MTAPQPAVSTTARPTSKSTSALAEAITTEFAELLGWDPQVGIVTFPQEHPTLGWNGCAVTGCGKPQSTTNRLCPTCTGTWNMPDIAVFLATTVRHRRWPGRKPCTVPGCQRPWTGGKNALCQAHLAQQQKLGLSLEEFYQHADVVPRVAMGPCKVVACTRDRMGQGRYCSGHAQRWRNARRAQPGLDQGEWERTVQAISEDNVVSLRGLPDRVVMELLYALQQRSSEGIKTKVGVVRPLLNQARLQRVASLADLPAEGMSKGMRSLRNTVVHTVDELESDPGTGWERDRWSLAPMGHRGTLRFGRISQPWLREGTKRWAFDDLPTRRGPAVAATLQAQIEAMIRLSQSLHRHRDDHGMDPRLLTRSDIVMFLNWLAYLTEQGELSQYARGRRAYDGKRLLHRMRSMGLTRTGQPLHGLPDDFALSRQDMPALPEDDGVGRDLPPEIVTMLSSHLGDLDGVGCSEVRTAIELMMDTGRRPTEICLLPLDCLHRDQDGKPVLIYDNHKALRLGRRLPISEVTAQTILAQQDRVRARYPNTPTDQLTLLPAPTRNPDGRRAITNDWVTTRHRQWINGLPELTAPAAVEVGGHTVTRNLPFPKSKVFPYAWRHTYAQRHADAGVPVDVLCDLMDHKDMGTTQGYYRVGEQRRRDAVDRVTTMQFDRHGDRIWRQASALLDSERVRRAVGEVAVPYGVCTEPTNVAAGGQDCPVRFRCVGCGHFRTDVSYLPDLEAYLADLLRNRESLLASVSTVDADDWAKAEAMPSAEEIRRIRTLIARVKADLDDLDEHDRAQIEEAVTTVRAARNRVVGLGLPRARPIRSDIHQERIS